MEEINWIALIFCFVAGFIIGRASGFRSGYKEGELEAENRMWQRTKRMACFNDRRGL